MSLAIDELKLYFGDNYHINKFISIRHPLVGDVVELGERDYFSTVHTICAIPSDMKSQLWDMGICWEDMDDFELFAMLIRTLDLDKTRIFFGELDFTKFELGINPENNELVIYQYTEPTKDNSEGIIKIDRLIYLKIVEFLRTIHGIKPKIERAGSKTVQKILIEEDRRKLARIKNDDQHSQLLPLVSSLINCSEFKYGLHEIRQMPIYAFMDSVSRVQIIKSSTALLQGCYSGMLDTSKIDKKELNWMRDIKKDL